MKPISHSVCVRRIKEDVFYLDIIRDFISVGENRIILREGRKMKTITIQIKDETAEALDKAINSRDLCKYPKEQAYSLFIDALVSEVRNLPCCCCSCVPEHQHPPAWCF